MTVLLQVHFGIILVVLSAESGSYPFTRARFIFDYVGLVAASLLVGLVLHMLVGELRESQLQLPE